MELAPPGSYDERFTRWNRADLPILPKEWQYLVSSSTKKQFDVLCKLMCRAEVESLICATDAGREGELIFRLVYHQCGCVKPFTRLWISSMEDAAIRAGFANLKPSAEYDALYKAALCRERADWLVGINASRLFSCLHGQTLNVGRVMTPTLGMTVERETAIEVFRPELFYTVVLGLSSGITASSKRFDKKSEAEKVLASCRKEMELTIQKIKREEKTENPPLLYDLTTLQRDANRWLGYSAQQTLDYVQSLYEQQLSTYPRTDSRYVTDDMEDALEELAEELEEVLGMDLDWEDIDEDPVRIGRIVNSRKVSDHHAILPTRKMLQTDISGLPEGERNILRLIITRLMVSVSPPYKYEETHLETECAGEVFSAKSMVVLQEGWKKTQWEMLKDILGKAKEPSRSQPVLEEGEVAITSAELKEGKTSPPKHFTEDTLLSAMESAGKESLSEEAERRGIGTPATRAAIIEKLVKKGFLTREGSGKTKNLIPTEKGRVLIAAMPEQLKSPAMTADWEKKLAEIEHSNYTSEQFMEEIESMMKHLVNQYANTPNAPAKAAPGASVVGVCPHCGADVAEREKGWFCSNRECRFVIWKDNAFFKRLGKHLTRQLVDKLLRDGRARLKDCKSQRTGKTYNASVLMATEADGRAKFSLEFENSGGGR